MLSIKHKTQYSVYTPLHRHVALAALADRDSLERLLFVNIYVNYEYLSGRGAKVADTESNAS